MSTVDAASEKPLYGIMLEFAEPEPLLAAAELAYSRGYRELDAFTPYAIEGLAEAIGFRKDHVSLVTLICGLSGGITAFGFQWYANVIDYPINTGGRPYFSWPAFIPITFELTILGAAFGAAIGMLAMNRLPKPWHPAFNLPEFSRASRDRFFLCIQAKDPQFEPAAVRELFADSRALSVREVELEE
jgi:hypothetical protein